MAESGNAGTNPFPGLTYFSPFIISVPFAPGSSYKDISYALYIRKITLYLRPKKDAFIKKENKQIFKKNVKMIKIKIVYFLSILLKASK